jgi:hypothetical protein
VLLEPLALAADVFVEQRRPKLGQPLRTVVERPQDQRAVVDFQGG